MFFIEINTEFGGRSEFLYIFIITILVVWSSLIIYSLRKHGAKKTIRYFVPMMLTALFLEASAVSNGRYVYTGYIINFSILGGSVPLIILLGWSSNLFLFLNMGKHAILKLYQKQNLIQIILISTISSFFGVCLDLLEDPIAQHNKWWIWNQSASGLKFYEVPFSNLIDWFIIIFYMSLVTLLIDRSRYSENRKLAIAFSSLPIAIGGIFATHLIFMEFFKLFGFT
jgi:uncharacterized membrane protein